MESEEPEEAAVAWQEEGDSERQQLPTLDKDEAGRVGLAVERKHAGAATGSGGAGGASARWSSAATHRGATGRLLRCRRSLLLTIGGVTKE